MDLVVVAGRDSGAAGNCVLRIGGHCTLMYAAAANLAAENARSKRRGGVDQMRTAPEATGCGLKPGQSKTDSPAYCLFAWTGALPRCA